MIYLFEDRKDRMATLLNDEMHGLPLEKEKVINIEKSELKEFFLNLIDLEAVILHKSYSFPQSNITIEDVRKIVRDDLNKPFIIFSGGLNNAVVSEMEAVVNSGTLYRNIKIFLTEHENTGSVNLPLLIFGPGKYLKNEIMSFRDAVFPLILKLEPDNDDQYRRTVKSILNEIETKLIAVEFSSDKEKLSQWLKGHFSKRLNQESLYDQLLKFVNKYESN